MSSSLHYVTPLQLSDTFNEWFLRSNDLIDVVNKINVYNVESGWGLARYRSIDGTTVLRINIGQRETEYNGLAVTGDYNYGLRFIDDIYGTGSTNPDVSSSVKILTLDFENLPDGSGGISGAIVNENDYYAFSDTSSGTGSVGRVLAGNILPYGISGDHRFYGNVYFDGDTTTINSTELNIDDKLIYLATSGSTDGGTSGLDDQSLHGAGIVIVGISGDKSFTYEYANGGGEEYHAFKPNIDLLFDSSSRILSQGSNIDFIALTDDDFDIGFQQAQNTNEFWKIRKKSTGDGAGRLIFLYENISTGVTSGAITLSDSGNVKIHQLDGDVYVDGTTHDSTFKYMPAPYSVPTTGMSGDSHLNYKWTNRKVIKQIAHGFTAGDLIKYYNNGTTYDLAYNSSKTTSEVIAIVENDNGGSADSFVAVFNGLVDLSEWTPTNWAGSAGTTMSTGEVYFLDSIGFSGGFTSEEPFTNGDIRKPVLVSVEENEALFVNYIGNVVSTGDGSVGASGDIVYSDGYLTNPSIVPNQGYKNKIINGDFSFWQRAEDYRIGITSATNWDGSTGTRWTSSTSSIYTADMWLIETRHDGTDAEIQKLGHTFGSGPVSTYGTQSRGSYLQALNNTPPTPNGDESWVINRIENVSTFAAITGKTNATVSYWVNGVSQDVTAMTGMTVSLWQVFDGNSGSGISYGGGATCCLGIDSSGNTFDGGMSADIPTSWTKKAHTFIINSMTELDTSPYSYDEDNNWLELRFSLPCDWGVSGGIDLARIQLEAGATATDWEERSIQEEEVLVNRYYQRHPIYTTGYVNSGNTLGAGGKWSTMPYPYYGVGQDTSITSCYAYDRGSNNITDNANTGDIWLASPNYGFNAGRTSASSNWTSYNAMYHFDFGIYN